MFVIYTILSIVSIILLIYFIGFFAISGPVHREMSSDYSCEYGTFNKFKSEWRNHNLVRSNRYPNSYFSQDHKSQWHASLIQFGGKYMILNSFDFFLATMWVRFFLPKKTKKSWVAETPKINSVPIKSTPDSKTPRKIT